MTYYVTKPVKALTGKDTSQGCEQEIDQAIGLALLSLKEEAGTDMELIGVSTTVVPASEPKLYVTVIAKTYQPVQIRTDIADMIGIKVPYGGVHL